jgi:hypothetical protein
MKYYTDQEILDMIESKEVTKLVAERFALRQNRIDSLQTRINVAAEYMGHNLISELEAEKY